MGDGIQDLMNQSRVLGCLYFYLFENPTICLCHIILLMKLFTFSVLWVSKMTSLMFAFCLAVSGLGRFSV